MSEITLDQAIQVVKDALKKDKEDMYGYYDAWAIGITKSIMDEAKSKYYADKLDAEDLGIVHRIAVNSSKNFLDSFLS